MLAILQELTVQSNKAKDYKIINNFHNKYETASLKMVKHKKYNSNKYNKNHNNSPTRMRHTRMLRW